LCFEIFNLHQYFFLRYFLIFSAKLVFNISELYFHQTSVIYGFTGKRKNKELDEERLDTKANYYKNKAQYIRRLINMKYDNQTKFLTLTFADGL
jgi:hypothetical protein